MTGKPPRYRRYRGGPARDAGNADDPLQDLRNLRRSEAGQPLAPTARSRNGDPQPAGGQKRPGGPKRGRPEPPRTTGEGRRSLLPRRALRPSVPLGRKLLRWFFVWAFSWAALSLVVFLISAQLHQADVGASGNAVLGGGATPPVGTSTVLVIGSDTRTSDTKEPGAATKGYGRSDSIMLMRVGGGKVSKLSIARDTVVQIPGYGQSKINAAYAYGGPGLLVKTVEQYTGVDVNHVMQIGFDSFPALIDAMGGITYKGACVVSRINGGYKNGGITLRIPNGKRTHLNGKQALALSRTRHNDCNSKEDDLTRARRQQRVMSSIKRRALSPIGFLRLPLIAWAAPKTLDSDMAGPRLLATMAGLALSTGGKTNVLGTESGYVTDAQKTKAVNRFLDG